VTSRSLLVAVLALGIVLPAVSVRAAPLPERPPPFGFASVNGPAGGRTLAGTFSGNTRSAAAVLGGMLGVLRGYFDGAPAVSSAVGDPADRGIMAFFDARLQGTSVRGAVLVQLNDGGGGGVAVIFDRPADIARSFPAMSRQLGGIQVPGGGPAQPPVALQQQTTPDGKAAIGVPPGWHISGYGNGAVDVAGPQGQLVDVGIFLPIMVRPTFVGSVAGTIYLPFIADPAAAVPVVSQALSQQTVARGGQGTTNVEVLERYNTPPPTGAGQAAYLHRRSALLSLRAREHGADRRQCVDLLLLLGGRARRRVPARLRTDAERLALVVAQPADAARPPAGRRRQDAPDRRDPALCRARAERCL
jgi:hypothetical protein